MLKLRVMTAVVLGALVLGAIFVLPVYGFVLFVAPFVALGLYEWASLARLQTPLQRAVYAVLGAVVGLGLLLWLDAATQPLLVGSIVALCVGLWAIAAVLVLSYPRLIGVLERPGLVAVLGWLILLGTWTALTAIRLHPAGAWWLVWLFLVIVAADIGAYFTGKAFGKHKLIVAVSPGKTWEGAAGGLLSSVAVGLLVAWLADLPTPGPVLWSGWIAVIAVVSILGDLFESTLKRAAGVKDSGGLLPGHGGVLDRIDSIISASPVFAAWLLLA